MTTPDIKALFESGRKQVMLGVGLVMGAVVLAGLTAVVLAVLGQREAGMAVGAVGGVVIVAGILIQGQGMAKLKAAKEMSDPQKPGASSGVRS